MDPSDQFIKELFAQTERDFQVDSLDVSPKTRGRFLRLRPSNKLLVAASILLLFICLTTFSVPEMLYEGVAASLEIYESNFNSWVLKVAHH